MQRAGTAARLAETVTALARTRRRVLVGIDGPDAAGKTTLADQLAAALPGAALRVSLDGFHRPAALRYRRGELSAEGYYRDSFDYPAVLAGCLLPFRAGARRIRVASYDYRAGAPRAAEAEVPERAVLIVDGVFLLCGQLRALWDRSVYLRVPPAELLRRAEARDVAVFGSVAEVRRRYQARYLPAQALYQRLDQPEAAADMVIDNEVPGATESARWRP